MKYRIVYLVGTILTAFIMVCAATIPLQPRPIQAATNDLAWSTPVIINDDGIASSHQKNPDMVVMDGLGIYVVWEDYRNSNSEPDIYFSRSTDGGNNWSANTQVNIDSLSFNNDPHVAVDSSGTIYVAWLVPVGDKGIYFSKSSNGGTSWSASKKLWSWPSIATVNGPASVTTDAGNALDLVADTRAGREGYVHIVSLRDYNEKNTKVGIAYSVSSNGGDSWGPSRRVANGTPGWELNAMSVAMAFRKGKLYVAWENLFGNRDIYLSSSQDGLVWGRSNQTASEEGSFFTPDVAVDGAGMAYETYYGWLKDAQDPFDYRGQGIRVRKTAWGSTVFASKDRILSDDTIFLYKAPDLAAGEDGRVFIAWSQKLPGDLYPSMYVGESNDFALNWITPVMVSESNHYGEDPALEIDGNGSLYAVWMDHPKIKCCYDILFSGRGPSTSTPDPPKPFTETINPAGGTLVSNDPLESVEFDFPEGWTDTPTEVTYSHGALPTRQSAGGTLVSMGVHFDVSAEQGGSPLVNFDKPVTITTRYFGSTVAPEDSINLYWQNGSEWVTDGISTVGREENVITSTTNHFTYFGLFGEVDSQLFLPTVMR